MVLFLFASYFLGAIPFGLIIGKFFNKNLQKLGSGNIGATNATRLIGKKAGILTLALDFAKCFFITCIAKALHGEFFAVLCGAVCTIAHIFSVYIKFKGGKGVACAFALYFALSFYSGVLFLLLWCLAFYLFKKSFIGSLSALVGCLVWSFFNLSLGSCLILIFLTFLIFVKHKTNILSHKF